MLILLVMGTTQAKASQLYLRTQNGGPMTLHISGYNYDADHGEFAVYGLPAGNHNFVIQKAHRGRGHGHRRGRGHGRGNGIFFSGSIYIPARSTVIAHLTPRGYVVVDRVIRHKRRGHVRSAPPRGPQRGDRRGYGRELFEGSYAKQMLFQQMDALGFESERKEVALEFFRDADYTSQDVLDITNRFEQEANKLQLAKEAYHRVEDPENYLLVQSTFGFQHSKKVLSDYIF